MFTVIKWCVAIALVLLVVGCATQRKIVFPRGYLPPARANPPINEADGSEVWHVDVDGGRVEAFFLPGDGVSVATPGPAVLYAHGNGEMIDMLVEHVRPYRAAGVSVLLVEYRGYGRSAGSPSEAGIVADATEFYDQLVVRPEVVPEKIVFHGVSLGGGVVASLSRAREPAAFVLVSTFRSLGAMAAALYIPPFLVADPFDTEDALALNAAPVLLMHGRADEIVPFTHAEALASQLGDRATLVPFPGSHNAISPDRGAPWRATFDFLVAAGVLP